MSALSDLDRPLHHIPFPRWGPDATVPVRKLGAAALLHMQADLAELHGVDVGSEESVRFFCELLSLTVEEPRATADEWRVECTLETLTELGVLVARYCGMLSEEKKTGSTEPLPASPSPCAAPCTSDTPTTSGAT